MELNGHIKWVISYMSSCLLKWRILNDDVITEPNMRYIPRARKDLSPKESYDVCDNIVCWRPRKNYVMLTFANFVTLVNCDVSVSLGNSILYR